MELDAVRGLGEGMAYGRQMKRKVGASFDWQLKSYTFFQQTIGKPLEKSNKRRWGDGLICAESLAAGVEDGLEMAF